MKTFFVLLFATVATVTASDIRIVGGSSVDLQPLHDWHESHKGERPLPHWREIHVLAINGNSSSTTKLHVKIEGRAEMEILAKNLPPEIVQYFGQVSGLTTQINQLKDYIASQQVILDRASAAGSDAKAAGNTYARPANLSMAKQLLKERRAQLQSLQVQLGRLQANEGNITKDFALSTGAKSSGLEIWDFGVKRK